MAARRVAAGSESDRLHSVKRVMAVLETLAAQPHGVTPKELSQQLGLHLSTVYRLLTTLQETGYVTRAPGSGLFRLGARVAYLHQGYLTGLCPPIGAFPFLRALQQVTGETVTLWHLEGNQVVITEVVEGSRPGATPPGYPGLAMPADVLAAGRVLLAQLPAETLEAIAAQRAKHPEPPFPVISRSALHTDLEQIRQCGFAIDRGHGHRDVWCVAAPLAGYEGAEHAAIAITAPPSRFARDEPALIAAVLSTTRAIEAMLPAAAGAAEAGAASQAGLNAMTGIISRAMSRAVATG